MERKRLWAGFLGVVMILTGLSFLASILWSGYVRPLQAQAEAVEKFQAPISTSTQAVLTSTPTVKPTRIVAESTSTLTLTPTNTPTPEPGDFLLEISKIGLEWVVHEIDELDLNDPWRIPKNELDQFCVVRFPEMSFPGQFGVTALAGHRDISGSPFLWLDKLREGDAIKITLNDGQIFEYTVVDYQYVDPNNLSVLELIEGSPFQLRLVTCMFGSILQRLIIFAEISEE